VPPICRCPYFFGVYYNRALKEGEIGAQPRISKVVRAPHRAARPGGGAVCLRDPGKARPEPVSWDLGHRTPLDKDTCRGVFRFGYDTKSRQALTDLIARQPDLRKKLSDLLVEPSYPVASLDCDRGDQTYVLLNDQQLVAIYRDGDIAAIDRLARH